MKIKMAKSSADFNNILDPKPLKFVLLFNTWDYQDIHLIDYGGRWVSKPNLVFLEQKTEN